MSERKRLPTDRHGQTSKLKLGKRSIYVTINKDEDGRILECFGAGDGGVRPELDGLCGLVSSPAGGITQGGAE